MQKTATVNIISVFIDRLASGQIAYKLTDIYGKYLTSGVSSGFEFDEDNDIFTASRVRAHKVAELVFNF